MDLRELEELLAELRHVRTDHQAVEAKRAGEALPDTTHETLSAFANTDGGGILLLGVDEARGAFNVTGVSNAQKTQSDLQSACVQMDPPLRPTIDIVSHLDGVVVVATVPPVPRNQRPCHRDRDSVETSSFIRVGDGDQRLNGAEVAAMLANRTNHDYSAAPAPAGSALDPAVVAAFIAQVHSTNREKYQDLPDEQVLRQFGATAPDGHPTYAGLLSMGVSPETYCAAALVSYRRLRSSNPLIGARHSGTHHEGTVGELLDATMAALTQDLDVTQVVRGGQVYDELDVPREALREVVSNALVHRSLADPQRETSINVDVTDEAVVIESPGSLHVSADPTTLGLATMAGVRNLSLVRQSEQLRTPSGARISEHQTSGIAAADRICHENGTMPPLFVDHPAMFQALLIRHAIDTQPATDALAQAGLPPNSRQARLLAVLYRLDELRETATTGLGSITFDAQLAARALAPCRTEDAAAELRALEDAGLLRRTRLRLTTAYVSTTTAPAEQPAMTQPGTNQPDSAQPGTPSDPADTSAPKAKRGRPRKRRVGEVVAAIAASPNGELGPKDIATAMNLSSASARTRWIREAVETGFIVSTTQNPFDPHTTYRLTHQGRRFHEAQTS